MLHFDILVQRSAAGVVYCLDRLSNVTVVRANEHARDNLRRRFRGCLSDDCTSARAASRARLTFDAGVGHLRSHGEPRQSDDLLRLDADFNEHLDRRAADEPIRLQLELDRSLRAVLRLRQYDDAIFDSEHH